MIPVRGVVVVIIRSNALERSLGWPGVSIILIRSGDCKFVSVVVLSFVIDEEDREMVDVKGTIELCVSEAVPLCNYFQ